MTARFPYDLPASERVAFEPAIHSCVGCAHRLRRGTCAEPVAAGLALSFEICWAPDGHVDTCAAFVGRMGERNALDQF